MAQPHYDEYEAPQGLWGRLKDRFMGYQETVEDEDDIVTGRDNHGKNSIRLEKSKFSRVAVRLNASVFNDARSAADGLKAGSQQIVNLEKAPAPMAERIIDFLSGVTYALDGTVERIGEKVFLFAPANVDVETEGQLD